MALENHTLTVSGETRSLAEWDVSQAVMTSRLGGEDSLVLTVERGIDVSDRWPAFALVTLRDPDGIVRFAGRLVKSGRSASASAESQQYEIAGPWYYLTALTLKMPSAFAADPLDPESTTGIVRVARTILNRTQTGEKLTLREQMEEILDYAQLAGAPIAFDVSGMPTTEAPEDEVMDLRIADAIRREMAWCPHIGCRWDYSGFQPKLEFLSTTSGGVVRTLALGTAEQFTGRPRHDLLCPEVRIDYIGENAAGTGANIVRWLTLHTDVSTFSNGAFGSENSTIVLRGLVWDGSTWTAPEERPPDGLAASLHEAYARLFYDMAWRVTREEVLWGVDVGERWNISGPPAAWLSAQSVCQVITRDIGTGTTSFECGPPAHLGLGKRLDILRANRRRNVPQNATEQTYGMASPDTAGGGFETRDFSVFVDGTYEDQAVYVPGPGTPEGPYP